MKLDLIVKKDGKLQERYVREFNNLVELSSGKAGRVYGKKWLRNGRHKTLVTSEYDRTLDLLKAFGIKYAIGNDAPKGGLEGDYIDIRFDGRNKAVQFIRSIAGESIRNVILTDILG